MIDVNSCDALFAVGRIDAANLGFISRFAGRCCRSVPSALRMKLNVFSRSALRISASKLCIISLNEEACLESGV